MSTKIIGLVIGVLLLLGAGAFAALNRATVSEEVPLASSKPVVVTQSPASDSNSLRALMGLGIVQQCIFNDVSEGGPTEGKVYVANNKMRGDFVATRGEQKSNSHIIVDEGSSYVWVDGTPGGVKTSVNIEQTTDDSTVDVKTNDVDLDKSVAYTCSPWIVDASVFTPPANVQFTDLASLIQPSVSGVPGSTQVNTPQCAACDGAPEPGRTQCRTALGCK